MNTQSNKNGVTKTVTKSEVEFGRLFASDYQKEGTLTAEVRQAVKTVSSYPSKKVTSNMNQTIFDEEDFGFEAQEFESIEERVAWLQVPATATEQTVAAALAKANKSGACIYKVLSNKPILDDNQQYSITAGLRSLDDYADSQAVRYPDDHDMAGQLILDTHGNPQYRRTFFWSTPKEDIDLRNSEEEPYISAEMSLELKGAASVIAAQKL